MSTTSTSLSAADSHEEEEDTPTQRRRLAAVWLAAGSAVAFMVGGSWLQVIQSGGVIPGGDMAGHAAAAEWLRTLPWWDWRGWSDWFYGGQAIGVNYPPLGLNWTRFTHPVHGQMAAVALGLLVLLPWGTLRLARAVGYPPPLQRIAVGAVLALTAGSGLMHWPLSGFHAIPTFFGSWPAMMAVVTGLFTAAWAARCHRPVAAGIVTGVALLWNATVIPGLGAVCLALLATSGASFRQATRWTVTAGAAALVVSGWWLVPFLDSWDRLVRWEVPLHRAWEGGGSYQNLILAGLGFGAAWVARRPGPARRLAGASLVGLGAVLLAEWAGWLRPERWLSYAVITAVAACAGIAHRETAPLQRDTNSAGWLRPVWRLHAALGLVVFAVLTLQIEFLAPALGLVLIPSRRTWAWMGVLAWAASLYWGGLWELISPEFERAANPLSAVAARSRTSAKGLVGLDRNLTITPTGDFRQCPWDQSWLTTAATDGDIRPLAGLYRETNPSAEFIEMERLFYTGDTAKYYPERPDWFEVWQSNGKPVWSSPAAAEALGGRWYVSCDENGDFSVVDLAGVTASGATVSFYPSEGSWHRSAAQWWIPIAGGPRTGLESLGAVPILSDGADNPSRPASRAASGVWLRSDGDRLAVGADEAGWAWLRVPWDPYWSSPSGAAVHKGGPGHLVVWVPEGETELVWRVPAAVDTAAVLVTGFAVVLVLIMSVTNRRQDQERDPDRHRPVRATVGLYADTVDSWLHAVGRWARSTGRTSRPEPPGPAPADAAAVAEGGSRR